MKRLVVGVLAHVDAGKTTLAEALLYRCGVVRALGRVDHGDSHLDVDAMERQRGITIFSKQAVLQRGDASVTLLDTPGHTDFSAEAERVLQVLDYAVLVVAGNDGVQGHTLTLWRLLQRYNVPTVLFVNKMDLAGADRAAMLQQLQSRLSPTCLDFSNPHDADVLEQCAMTDEQALNEFLEQGELMPQTLQRLVAQRQVFPCFFGSALRMQGVDEFLDGALALMRQPRWSDEFAARVYKVSHAAKGERLSWLKLTGGQLHVKDLLSGAANSGQWSQKVNQIRVYQGEHYEVVPSVATGQVCAVMGLADVMPGDSLGAEPVGWQPFLQPVLAYSVYPGQADAHEVHAALRLLAEEDPLLSVQWDEQLQEVCLSLMGTIQLEVVRQQLAQRFGFDQVQFGPGGILYKETITAPVAGVGHFEPLRHYAEVHVQLQPTLRGSGMEFGSTCSEDSLARNWQRLALTNAMERTHAGVLTGAPLDDVRITLTAGRAHLKHTEGGDFRQATYRAIRQALMRAREQGLCVLLEPWYRFRLEVPADKAGRALSDLQRMGARFDAPVQQDGFCILEGEVPASESQDYAVQVSAYSAGQGHFSCEFCGYEPCHDADSVIARMAYDPESDLPNTPDSVFCSHGAGHTVKWRDVPAHAHVDVSAVQQTSWRRADDAFFGT